MDPYPEGWWHAAFQNKPNASELKGKPAGSKTMLLIIAYDICNPKRLKKVAEWKKALLGSASSVGSVP